jgi:amino acid permease
MINLIPKSVEDYMNQRTRTSMTILAATFLASPACASASARSDNSSLLVWGFLAVCALIIGSILIPAFFGQNDTDGHATKK